MRRIDRRVAAVLAGLLGVCCVGLTTVIGGTAAVSGVAGVTAVTTGGRGLGGVVVSGLVTGLTLLSVVLVFRWQYG